MRRRSGCRMAAMLAPLALILLATQALAQGQAVSMGTNPPGSVFYSVGSGLAKVVSDSGKLRMAVQPYAGSSTFIPLLNSGEMEFGVVNAVDMALAYRGPGFKIGGRNPFPHTPNARILMNGSPFMVGEKQRAWLKADLDKVAKTTPVVVFSHSPLQKLYKGWNFWTDDADEVQALLRPFDKVNVIYGHVHQIQYNQVGNIAFNAVMATAWPWPYPQTYAHAEHAMPVLTVPMNRADPFHERDATGWQFIDVHTGRVALNYNLYNNTARTVAFNPASGRPEDKLFQDPAKRIPPQEHY